jgi:hypothetical protein
MTSTVNQIISDYPRKKIWLGTDSARFHEFKPTFN